MGPYRSEAVMETHIFACSCNRADEMRCYARCFRRNSRPGRVRIAITQIDWSKPRYPLRPQVGTRLIERFSGHVFQIKSVCIKSRVILRPAGDDGRRCQVIQRFASREDLIEVLLASCCV